MKGSVFQGFSEATLQKQALVVVAVVVLMGLVGGVSPLSVCPADPRT